MFVPQRPKPSGFQTNKQSVQQGSGGTLGSAMSKAAKKKAELDKSQMVYGVHSDKLVDCPGCGLMTCYYMGGGPKDIECANSDCQFYRKPPKEEGKRYFFGTEKPYENDTMSPPDDEDTKELSVDDIDNFFI